MQDFDEVKGKRILIQHKGENWYLFISRHDVMATLPSENALKNAEMRGMVEALCRVSSKGMKLGLSLSDVAEQMRKADLGRASILGKISDVITDFAESHERP